MNTFMIAVLAVIGLIVSVAGIGLLLAFPIMWCWNYTLPVLFGIKCITWGQAWCLDFLAGMLIKPTLASSMICGGKYAYGGSPERRGKYRKTIAANTKEQNGHNAQQR